MNFNILVVVSTYASEAEASMAASRLAFQGIEAHLQKDDCGGAYPSLQMAGGVRLLVKPEELQDAERILNEAQPEDSREVEQHEEQEDRERARSGREPHEVSVMKDLPSQQLGELKTIIFTYVVMAPLLSALFAVEIDTKLITCLLFVGLVGTAFVHLRNRLGKLEESLKEQERRLELLDGVNGPKCE